MCYVDAVRIVSPRKVREFMDAHANSRPSLTAWLAITQRATWRTIAGVRRDFPRTDAVPMRSGRTATITNVGGNNYRVALDIHYNKGIVFVRRVMTHAEYSKNAWHADF